MKQMVHVASCYAPKVYREGTGIGGGNAGNNAQIGGGQRRADPRSGNNRGRRSSAQNSNLLSHFFHLFFFAVIHFVFQSSAELVGLGRHVGNVTPHERQVSGLDHPSPSGKDSGVDHQDGSHGQRNDFRTL